MKKITSDETLKAAVQELYDKTRTAMLERDGQWRALEITFAHTCKIAKFNGITVEPLPITFAHTCKIAKFNGITVEPLPIPKSTVQSAPQITTKAAQEPPAVKTPKPPVAGDVLADNAPRPKRKRSTRRKKSQ